MNKQIFWPSVFKICLMKSLLGGAHYKNTEFKVKPETH